MVESRDKPTMATTQKTKKPVTPDPTPSGELPLHIDRKRQIRLGTGMFLLLAGAFVCFSIISYYSSWNADQDKLFSTNSYFYFLFHDSAATNWGGRLGAVLSHILVFNGAGIASIVIGLAIGSLGLNMIYGKKALPIMRYIRWLSIILLLAAPTLTYLFPDSPFPIGGALGNVAIGYFNGLLGKAGTGMVLLSTILFFVFVIFALDLRPLMKKIGERLSKFMASIKSVNDSDLPEAVNNTLPAKESISEAHTKDTQVKPTPVKKPAEPAAEAPLPKPPAPVGNKLKENAANIPLVIENSFVNKEWDMDIVEKTPDPTNEPEGKVTHELSMTDEDEELWEDEIQDEDESEDDFEEMGDGFDEDEEPEEIEEQPELSFEVIHKAEKPTIRHGDHISIASNEPYAPELDLADYKFPTLGLLENRSQEIIELNKEELERNKEQIIQTLLSFGIEIQRIGATVGPTVTLYEIVPAKGVRISKIKNLEDDIALSLAALGIRIIAPIPGKGTIGIEVPNANKQIVSMQALLSSEKFVNNKMSLPIALGKKIDNENYIVDLATMPHLLMAGATGQGKSVGINAILVSLLYKKHPSQLKFVMVDPKKVELSIYRTIEKHFLAKLPNEEEPIITDIKKVIYTLKALCDEMDDRYGLLKDAGARNIKEYNEKFIARRLNPENGHKYLPFIVLVIDEFADLIMTAGKEVEMPIARLAQLARAVGIHLIIATQRPSVNVITGTIKANFPARIAFKVSAKVDSRTILDTGGAEQLVGRGDLLISNGNELLRLQCAFVDTPEVENVVNFIGSQRGYPKAHPLPEPEMDDDDDAAKSFDPKNRDKLFEDCARTVVQMQSGSTSNLQRRFNLGYNRAGRIMDQLEAANIVGPAQGSKPREVYFKSESELDSFLDTLK